VSYVIRRLGALKRTIVYHADRWRRGGLYQGSASNSDAERHLRETLEWLKRAQDAGTNRGVSYGADFGGPFLESYPETTGYIIPTFLKLADHWGDNSLIQRAVEMGQWESAVQMECGAVMGGMWNPKPTPAVFNTGMVLLGWSALYERTANLASLQSLRRASEWLISIQDPDGGWTKSNSQFANAKMTVYNVKAAWGLCEAGRVGNMPEAVQAAVRNAEFCIEHQLPNGWYRNCCLSDSTNPLLHTIAYAMQGLIGIGVIVDRQDLIQAAKRTADRLIHLMDANGFIPGRVNQDFRGAVKWCCLTGTAQVAIVWGRLFQLTGDAVYREAANRANAYLMRCHDIENPDPRLRGGVPGSWPVWGDYGRLRVLNWATNFFAEALLLQKSIACGME
jgi:uncharacterized protein YyaL (SSP411 family)